jgi:predicted cytidylate kinase
MRITISGPPGSGKSTVCKMLSDRLGIECVISGMVFREMAKEQGLDLEEFGKLAELQPRFDRLLDERMVRTAKEKKNVILEGRLTAHMLSRNGIRATKIFLHADIDIRAKRIAGREEREECEASRYRNFYGIDLSDKSVYDLVIDTTNLSPEQVVDIIISHLEA